LAVLDEIDHGRSKVVTGSAAGRLAFKFGCGRDETAGVHDHCEGVAIKRGVIAIGVEERDEAVDRFAARLLARARSHLGCE
jgi:hypothetical protein